MRDITKSGYVKDIITPDNYVLGASPVPQVILQPDRNWLPFVPSPERQNLKFETFSCTGFGTLNAIEAIQKRRWSLKRDYSERFVGTLAGTWPPGNSPHKVGETIRKHGLVADKELSFEDAKDLLEFYLLKGDIDRLHKLGKIWLQGYDFKHEWVFTDITPKEKKHEKLYEALQYSPVGASVVWGEEKNGTYIKPKGMSDIHWTLIVGQEKETGRWIANDSYPPHIKYLAPDFDFEMSKRYHLEKLLPDPEYYILNEILLTDRGFISQLLEFLFAIFSKKQ